MNLLMPSSAAPALDAARAQLPVAPAAPVAPATLPGQPGMPPFDLALQQLLGGQAAAEQPADDTDDAAGLPDLLVSGLLQPAALAAALPGSASPMAPDTGSAVAPTPVAASSANAPLAAVAAALAPAPVAAPLRNSASTLPSSATPVPAEAAALPAGLQPLPVLQAASLHSAPAQAGRPAWLADLVQAPAADGAPGPGHGTASALLAPELGSRAATATAQAGSTAAPQPLLDALGDRIALQMQRGSERVVIRLDPPMQGQIEISIRTDAAGATQVQLHGSSGELTRQLHAISDSLRQELVQRQPGEVTVQVGQGMREQSERQRQEQASAGQQEPGRALDEAREEDQARRFALAAEQDSR